jgi:hypothetical protein
MKVSRFTFVAFVIGLGCAVLAAAAPPVRAADARFEFIRVARDGKQFVLSNSKHEFHPWGFNYDHDRANRLLEDYWQTEWDAVTNDFREMKTLGANTVRIHLQLGKFMRAPQEPDEDSLRQLGRLLALAQATGLYLDITGLGCYKKEDVPQWYNALEEGPRWDVQARFWDAVARVCSQSPAVFCYDLMNEPVVTEGKQNRDWTPGAFGDRYFVQRLTLDFAGRTQQQIARAWVEKMVAAVRKQDPKHLITVGAIPWAMTWPGAKSLIYSKQVSKHLDFVSVHFYPKHGEVPKALKALEVYDIGKPIVIEEMFPLSCSAADLDQFIDASRPRATGWIGFYWGKTIEEYKQQNGSIADAITLSWLEYFRKKTPEIVGTAGR